jgi:beta-galactosidase
VLFWQWRPELLGPESPGYGLCTPSGELTDRARAAGALAASLRDRPELEDTEPASAPVGLLLSQDTALLTWGTDRSGHLYTDAVAGAYRLLADAGIPAQLLTAARVAADGVPDSVEALWWPMPLVCGDALAAALARFVGRGGRLVAEAGAGQYDECGWCRPGHPTGILRELFGVEVADGDVVDDPTVELPDGTAVRGAWQVETLLPVGPARALLVPTYPSLGYERRRDPETREAMVRLLGPPALGWAWDEPRPGLVARLLLRDGRPHAVVGVNHTDRPARLTVGDTTELVRPLSGAILSVAARLAGFL